MVIELHAHLFQGVWHDPEYELQKHPALGAATEPGWLCRISVKSLSLAPRFLRILVTATRGQ